MQIISPFKQNISPYKVNKLIKIMEILFLRYKLIFIINIKFFGLPRQTPTQGSSSPSGLKQIWFTKYV